MSIISQQNMKYKELVEMCLITQNYKKITVATLTLIKDIIKAHSMKIGLSKMPSMTIHRGMMRINQYLAMKMNISLYPKEMVDKMKTIEILVEKAKAQIPKRFIKELVGLYFDLQQLYPPEIQKMCFKANNSTYNKWFSAFKKEESISPVKLLISQKIQEKEKQIKSKIKNRMDEESIFELQKLHQLKNSLQPLKNKIQIKGNLHNDNRFQAFQAQSILYLLLGIGFLLSILSAVILTETLLNSSLLGPLGLFLLMFVAGTFLSFYLYFNMKKELVKLQW